MTRRFCLLAVPIALLVFGAAAQTNSQTPYAICGPDHPASEGHPCPTPPRTIFSPDPKYSEEARHKEIQGTVVLYLVVGADGRPSNIRVNRSLGYGLDEEAIAAVKRWKFEPSTVNGQPVPVKVSVEVNFRLYGKPGEQHAGSPSPAPAATQDANTLFANASSALSMNDCGTAIPLAVRVTEVYPRHNAAWNLLGLCYLELDELKKAENAFQRQIEVSPQSTFAYNNLGRGYARQRKFDMAIAQFRKQIGINPRDRYAHMNLAGSLHSEQKCDQAIPEYQLAVELTPENAGPHVGLARCYLDQGKQDSGVAEIDKAAALTSTGPGWNVLAWTLAEHKIQLDRAEQYARLAVSMDSSSLTAVSLDPLTPGAYARTRALAAAWDTLGWILFLHGDFTSAEKYIMASWTLSPNPTTSDHLAEVSEKLGGKDDALKYSAIAVAEGEVPSEGQDSDGNAVSNSRERLARLASSSAASNQISQDAQQWLERQNSFALPNPAKHAGSAEFALSRAHGQSSAKARWIAGDLSLKDFENEVATGMPASPADVGVIDVLRWGTLNCEKPDAECKFRLSSAREAVYAQLRSNVKPAAAATDSTAPQQIQVPPGASKDFLISKVQPIYPPLARQARVQGTVVLQALIGKDGTVQNLTAISGHSMLIQAAMDAVRQWRYKPYLLNGEPVLVQTTINVNFELSSAPSEEQPSETATASKGSSSESSSSNPPQSPPAGQNAVSDPSQEAFIIEHSVTKVVYNADGSGSREATVAMRVQSQAGVQDLAVLTFRYTSYNETVELGYVRVRKPDGTVVVTPDYNVQDMPTDVTRSAPMYSDVHEKHVTVKALGVGDVLEYVVRYRTVRPQVPGQFWYQYSFYKRHIAKDEELEISVPRDKYVNVSNPDYKPEINEEGGQRIYLWKTANLERKETEQDTAPSEEAPRPSVQLTTFHSWEEVGRWYNELQRPQLAVTPQLRARATELTKGLTSDDDKMRAIYNNVATRIHYVSLSFGVGRYQPHPAQDVFENEYGDCKDKHTLLATLLKAAGIEAWPALISASRKLDPELPSPAQFDHVITYVPRANDPIWLDSTPGVVPFGMLMANLRDKQALVIPQGKPAELKKTPADPPFPGTQTFAFKGEVKEDGALIGHIEQKAHGDAEVFVRIVFRNTAAAQWKELMQRFSYGEGFSGEVSNVTASAPEDTAKPFEFSYDYKRKELPEWAYRRFIAPLPPMGVESAATQEKKPADPVQLGALGDLVYTAAIEIPDGYQPDLPQNLTLSEPYADFHSEYKLNGRVITVLRYLQVKQNEVPLSSWQNYKAFSKAVADDWGAWIELNGSGQQRQAATVPTPGAETSNQDVAQGVRQVQEALGRYDTTTAEEIARGLAEKYPKEKGVHALLGYVYARKNENDWATAEFLKEEDLHPDNVAMYQALASYYTSRGQEDKTAEQYRKWLTIDAKNYDATAGLSQILYLEKKYPQAVELWERAAQAIPDNGDVRRSLGYAYLHNKQTDKGIALLERALGSDAKPIAFNDAAYILADQNVHLDKAKEWGDKALKGLKAESLKTQPEEEALNNTRQLGATWDTVGWIYFHMEEFEKAEAYLRAAFHLSQNGVAGDHLAQTYAKQGKKQEAAHTYRLAYVAGKGTNKEDVKEHYQELMGKSADPEEPPVTLRRGGRDYFGPEDELSRSHTHKLSGAAHAGGSATFSVMFSPGKIDNVTFVSGAEKLKEMAGEIASSKMRADFPNSDAVRLTRRGILVCGSVGCDFTLLPQDIVHAAE